LLPVIPAFAFGSGSFGSGTRSILGLDAGPQETTAQRPQKPDRRLLQLAALTVAFVAVGYASSEPFRSERSGVSISKLWGRAWERTQVWLHQDKAREAPVTQVAEREPEPWHFGGITRIKANPAARIAGPNAAGASTPPSSTVQWQSSQPPAPAGAATIQASIPRSLRASLYGGAVSNVSDRVAPSLLAALEPIAVPEELSARLLLQKVAPGYPEQALRSGLQGSVVLQALIGRDGYIRDLKLIRGSFLLGKAAYQAVRQWRYQPWIVNGRAVEAETLVTVDFRLPQVSQSSISR
jgi:TonB family protein